MLYPLLRTWLKYQIEMVLIQWVQDIPFQAVGSYVHVFIAHVFYKKLGSGHTKSFLVSHEILSILILKVS